MALVVAGGETLSIGPGERWTANEVDLKGDIDLEGDIDLADSTSESASGSGRGEGSAIANRTYHASNTPTPPRRIARGETETIGEGVEERASALNLEGSLNLEGGLNLTASGGIGTAFGTAGEPNRTASASAAGEGRASGSAVPRRSRSVSAAGSGRGEGSARALVIIPAIRRNDADLRYDDSDDFDLGTDSR